MDLSIVIPAYQEEARLPGTLRQIEQFFADRQTDYEVIVVDDGSTDNTQLATEKHSSRFRTLVLPENRGKGAAVRTGMLASSGDRVLISDADLSSPIEEITRLETAIPPAQLAFGSRALDRSLITHKQPWYRQTMGRIFNVLLRGLGVRGVRDTQCGFKLLDGEIARELFADITTDGFAFDVELLLRAQRAGYRVQEVAVVWNHVEQSRVHPVTDSLRMLLEVARMRWRLRP